MTPTFKKCTAVGYEKIFNMGPTFKQPTSKGKSHSYCFKKSNGKAAPHDSVQFSHCHVWVFATPWTAARQASLSIINSRSLLRFMTTPICMWHISIWLLLEKGKSKMQGGIAPQPSAWPSANGLYTDNKCGGRVQQRQSSNQVVAKVNWVSGTLENSV